MHSVVAGALVRDGQVLLVHRHPAGRWYPDVWDLPGGHVREGEQPLTALARELHEQLGVQLDVAGCVPVGDVLAAGAGPGDALHVRIWHVRDWTGTPVNRFPDEYDDLGWFTSDRLPGTALAHAGYAALLAGLLRG